MPLSLRNRRVQVYGYSATTSDAGTVTIYAGTRASEAPRVVELICRELRRIQRDGIGRRELNLAKNHLKGSLMLGLESSHGRMSKLAKDELYLGHSVSLNEVVSHIDRVSVPHVHELSRRLFDQQARSLTALGLVSERSLVSALN